jgi:hypothetical protein
MKKAHLVAEAIILDHRARDLRCVLEIAARTRGNVLLSVDELLCNPAAHGNVDPSEVFRLGVGIAIHLGELEGDSEGLTSREDGAVGEASKTE